MQDEGQVSVFIMEDDEQPQLAEHRVLKLAPISKLKAGIEMLFPPSMPKVILRLHFTE
jgi:hypothetical protein